MWTKVKSRLNPHKPLEIKIKNYETALTTLLKITKNNNKALIITKHIPILLPFELISSKTPMLIITQSDRDMVFKICDNIRCIQNFGADYSDFSDLSDLSDFKNSGFEFLFLFDLGLNYFEKAFLYAYCSKFNISVCLIDKDCCDDNFVDFFEIKIGDFHLEKID
ncbi:hypothetical protein EDEG_02028 [Edhazardia aedis USNM 41457]|uniref:Uncharacterized protein n=1 Tax=Edhazardia aedis (strain USNM 41457) TaxID=1003232 RepID=J9DQR2_EDHAE|nr:hypothetical protein EDEG_02028 [Edhazardia aedis USNM 41457]|eukprot:EJW03657.1 hypothetical protein EDEG_02028 [Edhazardia aedis USNM 41457]